MPLTIHELDFDVTLHTNVPIGVHTLQDGSPKKLIRAYFIGPPQPEEVVYLAPAGQQDFHAINNHPCFIDLRYYNPHLERISDHSDENAQVVYAFSGGVRIYQLGWGKDGKGGGVRLSDPQPDLEGEF